MRTFSQFTAHYAANRRAMPAAIAAQIRREGIGRVQERWSAARVDGVLDFSDLINRIETAVSGK